MRHKLIHSGTNQNIILNEAKIWLETPFIHGGFTKQGCDCGGLLLGVLKSCNLIDNAPLYHTFQHCNNLTRQNILPVLREYFTFIEAKDVLPGDFVAFSFYNQPTHLAIIENVNEENIPNSIIHSYKPAGKVVQNITQDYWIKKVAYLLRFG